MRVLVLNDGNSKSLVKLQEIIQDLDTNATKAIINYIKNKKLFSRHTSVKPTILISGWVKHAAGTLK